MTSPTTTTVEVLQKARALLEQGWCQDHHAEDAEGAPVPHYSERAACFCLDGALCRVTSPDTGWKRSPVYEAATDLLSEVAHELEEGCDFIDFNDMYGRTQAEVLDLMDRAIGLAKREAV